MSKRAHSHQVLMTCQLRIIYVGFFNAYISSHQVIAKSCRPIVVYTLRKTVMFMPNWKWFVFERISSIIPYWFVRETRAGNYAKTEPIFSYCTRFFFFNNIDLKLSVLYLPREYLGCIRSFYSINLIINIHFFYY